MEAPCPHCGKPLNVNIMSFFLQQHGAETFCDHCGGKWKLVDKTKEKN